MANEKITPTTLDPDFWVVFPEREAFQKMKSSELLKLIGIKTELLDTEDAAKARVHEISRARVLRDHSKLKMQAKVAAERLAFAKRNPHVARRLEAAERNAREASAELVAKRSSKKADE